MEEANHPIKTAQYYHLAAQSLSFYVISYCLLYFTSGLSVLYIAYDFDVPAKLFINSIQFDESRHSLVWTRDALISILMATPVCSFIIGIIAIFSFLISKFKNAFFLYFCLWLFLQAFNLTFGLLSENLITQTGLVKVAQQLGVKIFMMIVTVGVSLFFLFKSGIFAAKLLFMHMQTKLVATKIVRIKLAVFFFIIPWFFGSAITLLLSKESPSSKDFGLIGFMLLLLTPSFFVSAPLLSREIFTIQSKYTVALIIATTLICAIFYFLLHNGISF